MTCRQIHPLIGQGIGVIGARWHLRRATSLGTRCRVWGRPATTIRGSLVIGERLQLFSTVWTTELWVGQGAELTIGDRVFINYGCSIGATESIRIGSHCLFGTQVHVIDSDWHRLEPDRRLERPASLPDTIEDNV